MEDENNLTSAALDWADWTYDSHGTGYYDGFINIKLFDSILTFLTIM